MKNIINKLRGKKLGKRGAAIIMALIAMTVLVLLGLSVAVVSMAAMRSNAADATTNDVYYAAEAGVNSAIEQLKYEAATYYNLMFDASHAQYTTLYSGFFTALSTNAQAHFKEPEIEGVTTQTTFTPYNFDTSTDIGEYHISCQADIVDGTSYMVNGTVYIKRVDVGGGPFIWISDDAAIKAGGTLNLESKNSVEVNGGNILVSNLAYVEKKPGVLPYTITGGELYIDPFLQDKIYDLLEYPSYITPTISSPDIVLPPGGSVSFTGMVEPITLVTEDTTEVHFANITVPDGTMYIKGDLKLNNCVVYADMYVDGDVYINNYSDLIGNIYCRGNVYIDNATLGGNITSDGFVDYNNGDLSASILAADGITVHNGTSSGNLFSPGPITIGVADLTGGIVYSKTKLNVGTGTMDAIFFSGWDIEFMGDVTVNGTVIAKNDIYFKVDANKDLIVNYFYDEELVEDIITDPDNSFFFTTPGVGKLDEDIFIDQSVTAVGRIND